MLNPAAWSASRVRPIAMGRLHPATRLAGLALGLTWTMVAAPAGLLGMAMVVQASLVWTGLSLVNQWRALRPWSLMALLVVVIHTFTTLSATPLGVPSVTGLVHGVLALARVAISVALLALYLRVTPLDALVAGLAWWLRPLQRCGIPVQDLGLIVAISLGTVSAVMAEGRRIEMVLRMRRAGRGSRVEYWWRDWFKRTVDRVQIVVPLMEALGRRADALGLSLRRRRPGLVAGDGTMPVLEMVVLVAVVLAWLLFLGRSS